MVKINEQVPDFELDAYYEGEIKKIRLSEQQGNWVVLLFYPADFTFVCPTELQEAAENYQKFQDLGAEVLSISTDTAYVHKAWHEESPAIGKVQYPMLADPAGKVCRQMGTYIEEEGLSLRATFIIDPDGKLVSMDIHNNSIGRSAKEILRRLQAAKFVREHKGKVCPASWTPEMEALAEDLDLVGKI